MPVFETYAARKRIAEQAGAPDVYQYDSLPPFLRRQLSLLFTACIGPGATSGHTLSNYSTPPNNNGAWDAISQLMFRETPSFQLKADWITSHEICMDYLAKADDIDGLLTLIEICCLHMERLQSFPEHEWQSRGIAQRPADGLSEINVRFQRSSVGYQYVEGRIIRVDSEFLHSEVLKVALSLLQGPMFEGANAEFRKAHDQYRAGDVRDCNTSALRSMESVLKAICGARGWSHEPGATVEKLIAVTRQHGLFPDYLEGSFNQLIGAMKSGLPKVRDKQGGHGAGPQDQPIPDYIAGYALHLAASNIVLLAKAYEALPPMSVASDPP